MALAAPPSVCFRRQWLLDGPQLQAGFYIKATLESGAVIGFENKLAGKDLCPMGKVTAIAFPRFIGQGYVGVDKSILILEGYIPDQLGNLHWLLECAIPVLLPRLIIKTDAGLSDRAYRLDAAELDSAPHSDSGKFGQQIRAMPKLSHYNFARA
jgi:hypothetical protein